MTVHHCFSLMTATDQVDAATELIVMTQNKQVAAMKQEQLSYWKTKLLTGNGGEFIW